MLTRERIKTLMALGSAVSSVTVLTLAKRTGLTIAQVTEACEWACTLKIAHSLGEDVRGRGEYFAASDVVLELLRTP